MSPISLAPTAASNIYKQSSMCLAPDFWHLETAAARVRPWEPILRLQYYGIPKAVPTAEL